MAYTVEKLCCFGGQVESGNPKLWKYTVPYNRLLESYDDVTAENYFPIESGLKDGDIILTIADVLKIVAISEVDGVLIAGASTLSSDNIPS